MAPHTSSHSSSWHLSSIHVKAFKSFSRAASFQIGSGGLVGIVGPNGSGKSNLLEAIIFATGCNTALLRGCKVLRDVSSTDTGSQLPEVKLQFAKGRSESHLLEASLTPEGTRVYRLDGRLRSGVQVKDFLRSLGAVVDSTTVIQQASITRLTDSNNPSTLADLVAAASGLNSWNLETAAARQEITRTRRALKEIQNNISKVQAAAAADEQAIEAGRTAAKMEAELEQLLEQVVSALVRQQSVLRQQSLDAEQREQELQASHAAAAGQLQRLATQKQLLATQQAQVLADLETCAASSSSCGLAGDIAAAEAQLASLQAAAAAYAAQQAELLSCKEQLHQQKAKAQQLQGMLHVKHAAATQAANSLAAVQAAGSAADGLRQQVLETQKQAAAASGGLAQQRPTTDQRKEQLLLATAAVAAAEQHRQRLHTQAAAVGASARAGEDVVSTTCIEAAAAAATAAAAAADGHRQQVATLQQQLLQLQMDMELAQSSLTPQSTVAFLTACRPRSNPGDTTARPLHQCFTMKDAAKIKAASQLLVPLAVVAGPSVLQVLVADSMRDANQLLAAAAAENEGGGRAAAGRGSAGKLRIWPLKNLKVKSILRAQRAAQQALGAERVILPLDLLLYEQAYEPAMTRAFGGYVIAADDAAAAELVHRFGLSSVTLQGTVSRQGSMSGGWAGSSGSYGQSYWASKLQRDSLAEQVAAMQQQLAAETSTQQQLDTDRAKAEAEMSALEQLQQLQQELLRLRAAAAAAQDLFQQEKQCLAELQLRHGSLQQRMQQCREALESTERDAAGSGNGASKGSRQHTAVSLKQQLQQDAERAAAEAEAAQQQLQAAEDEVEQLAVRVEMLELQLSSMQDPQERQLLMQQHSKRLQELQQQQTELEHSISRLSVTLQELQGQVQEVDQQVLQQQKQKQTLQHRLQRAVADAREAVAGLQQSKQDLKQLLRDFAGHDAVHELATAARAMQQQREQDATAAVADLGTADAGGVPSAKELQQMSRKAKRLQQDLLQLQVPELPAAPTEICQSRIAQVLQFRQQADALDAAASALEQHITTCADQVYAANDAVFEDIAAGFSELCSSLLPSLELQLERTGEQAHHGLQFRFRRLEDTAGGAAAAESNGSSQWHTSLSQLSGGQQTLVSLAMLLAVARSGNGSGLFLLDEVDAALDEHNQARASALLKQLADAADGAGCQILCVTHNAAFQQVCDAFVQVVRGPNGSSMSAAAAAAQPAGTAGPASAAADGAAKGRVGGASTATGLAAAGNVKKKARNRAGTAAPAASSPAVPKSAAASVKNSSRSSKKVRFVK